jgi:Fe-S-cluster-containing hydrogenase component 2
MTKCNLCPEDATPRCVAACRTGALALRSGQHADEKKRNFAREMIGERGNG